MKISCPNCEMPLTANTVRSDSTCVICQQKITINCSRCRQANPGALAHCQECNHPLWESVESETTNPMLALSSPTGVLHVCPREREMHTDTLDQLRAELDATGDYQTALVYADALEEAGDPRAETVRLVGAARNEDDAAYEQLRERHGTLDDLIERMGARDQRLFGCDCAEQVLHLFEAEWPEDDRPREAIRVARLYADGQATAGELHAARDAAWDVARGAARDAAWAADRAAVWAAVWAASRAAAWAAAWAAAAWDDAWDDVYRWQYLRAIEYAVIVGAGNPAGVRAP